MWFLYTLMLLAGLWFGFGCLLIHDGAKTCDQHPGTSGGLGAMLIGLIYCCIPSGVVFLVLGLIWLFLVL